MPPVRAVLFDLDGTLVDTEPLVIACMVECLREAGHAITPERIMKHMGPPMPELLEQLFGTPREEAVSIYEAYLHRYEEAYLPRTQPFPAAPALLDRLRDEGVPLAIVTNKRERAARLSLDVVGWSDRFAAIVGNDTATAPKPYAAPLLFALDVLGHAPHHAAMVGDTESDMGAGKAAAVSQVIGVTAVRDADALRAAGATAVINSLEELPALLLGGA